MNQKYRELLTQIENVVDSNCSLIGNLSNIAAIIFYNISELNWVGYYFYDGKQLILNTFQGKVACTTIPLERGVCGKAARELKTILVEDVHQFADHIACDSASNSEIVIPLRKNEKLYGVLDIDSIAYKRFQSEEKTFFEAVAKMIEKII